MDKDNPTRLEHFSQNSPISLRPVRMRTLNPVTRYIVDRHVLCLANPRVRAQAILCYAGRLLQKNAPQPNAGRISVVKCRPLDGLGECKNR